MPDLVALLMDDAIGRKSAGAQCSGLTCAPSGPYFRKIHQCDPGTRRKIDNLRHNKTSVDMATVARSISLEEYLRTSYSPDREYVDGEIMERNLGQGRHAYTQGKTYVKLSDSLNNLLVLPEQRIQVTATRVRVPDVCRGEAGRYCDRAAAALCRSAFAG
jgi:hypothetical protein